MDIHWQSPGRESLELNVKVENQNVSGVTMKCSGSLAFLRMSQDLKAQLTGPVDKIATPTGNTPGALIWREVLQKIQGSWKLPVEHEELCHCRKVNTAKVDEAIVYGAHTPEQIRKRTSANTGCGTCLADIESLIKNRL